MRCRRRVDAVVLERGRSVRLAVRNGQQLAVGESIILCGVGAAGVAVAGSFSSALALNCWR